MIQELLGGSGTAAGGRILGSGERKISASPSPSPSPPNSSTTTTTPTQNSSENNQNQLRCPRCDSSNTKFCYYNNYNLTQPRHFCKTCRRYWTKGGALRNVPIGGGCRKNNKTSSVGVGHVIPSSLGKPSTGKLKTLVSSSEIDKSSGFLSGFDHELLSSNPNILWASPQSGHHLLALLRSTQNPNPNPNTMLNSVGVKEEGFFLGSHMMSSDQPGVALNARASGLGLDPSIGLCSNSFWRSNNQNHAEQHHQQQQNGNFILGEVQNTVGIPDHQLYHQRLSLRSSSSANYYSDHSAAVLVGNVMTCGSSSSSSSAILESAPVAGGGDQLAGHHNYWNINPSLSWSDLPTTNGAYP